jgi:hypothetical protein
MLRPQTRSAANQPAKARRAAGPARPCRKGSAWGEPRLPRPSKQSGAAPVGTEFSTANRLQIAESRLEQLLGGKVAGERPATCSPNACCEKDTPTSFAISCDDRLASALSIITLLAKAYLERCHEPH